MCSKDSPIVEPQGALLEVRILVRAEEHRADGVFWSQSKLRIEEHDPPLRRLPGERRDVEDALPDRHPPMEPELFGHVVLRPEQDGARLVPGVLVPAEEPSDLNLAARMVVRQG